jgi:hypothetical protein
VAAALAGDSSSAAGREPAAHDRHQPGEQTSLPERRAGGGVAVADGMERADGRRSPETGEGQRALQESKDPTILSPLLALLGVCWGAQGAEQQSRKHPRRRS